MSLRRRMKMVAVSGAATICAVVFTVGFGSGVAGADLVNGPTSLSTAPSSGGTCTTGCSVTPGTPYTSGQQIQVTVGPNNVLSTAGQTGAGAPAPNGSYYFEECEDPGGTTANLPTSFSGCEAGTLDIETTGNVSTGAVTAPAMPVYDLPDVGTVGGPTMTAAPGKCDVAPNFCVIGIFAANPNSGNPGFSRPHLFSAPFQITVGDGTDAGNNPGDGTPEVPLAIGLPLAAIGLFGGWTLVRRRRLQRQAA